MNLHLHNRKAFKYSVTFHIHKINIAIGFPCKLMVILRKGKKKIETNSRIALNTKKFEAKFNEPIKFESIYFKDIDRGEYIEEKNKVTVIIITHKGNKTAGVFELIPTDFLNNGKTSSMREAAVLKKCPDKKARFYYGVSLMRKAELDEHQLKY